jgi:hypothetical protein
MIQQVVRKSRVHDRVVLGVVLGPIAVAAAYAAWTSPLNRWVCCGGAALFVGFFTLLSLGTLIWPQLHPQMQMLKPFGDVWEIAKKIDAELADSEHTVVIAPQTKWDGVWRWHARVAVSRHWAVNLSPAAAAVSFLPDLVWVYKQLTVVRGVSRGKIAPGVGVHKRDGGHVWFRTETEDDADVVLEAIVERRPEVLTGFRGEWLDLAKAYPLAQAEEVERRRAAVERLTPQERTRWIDDRLAEADDAVRRVESAAQAARIL